jgi:quercetin dioxygenase-like cupin family protein
MDAKGFVIPSGGGSVLSMAPGRSAALKLLGRDTGDSIMLFEETAPAGTETTFHLHRDSDEVAYVLSGEITFKIDDEATVGGPGHLCLLAARRTACVEKHRHRNRPRAVPVYAGRCRRLFRGTAGPADRVGEWTRSQ